MSRLSLRTLVTLVGILVVGIVIAYVVYPSLCRHSASQDEAMAGLPGDDIVPNSTTGYTLATSIAAPPSAVWPWLVQMGQGRGGFYTHEWVENLMRADIHNADRIIPELQDLSAGDSVRLTPDPYLRGAGQYLVVAQMEPPTVLVFRQLLPNKSIGTWSYSLRRGPGDSTRLVFRRRGTRPSVFDRIAIPGYYFMDMGMLAGIKQRAESETR